MIGARPEAKGWIGATLGSLLIHGLGLAWLVWQPGPWRTEPTHLTHPPLIEIATVPAPEIVELPAVPAQTLTSVVGAPDAPSSPVAGEALLPVPYELPLTPAGTLPIAEAAPSDSNAKGGTEAVNSSSDGFDESTLSRPTSSLNPPRDNQDFNELVTRIRAETSDPCLLALPLLRNEDELTISLLSANDRGLSAVRDRLVDGIEGLAATETLLLDPRQCPAVAFLRQGPDYPLPALGLTLASPAIASGDTLQGQIAEAGGLFANLLLIDENGIVHDLSGFLTRSTGAISFDVPLARLREPRDTRQLLITLATPQRLDSVREHAGDEASAFFDALAADVDQSLLLTGIASVDLR
ncbi:hypothetical protein [Paracoccus jeotgali]|uniref:Uncharacterized protein n=1 Tax=Paracoccus jeotgali TaxID=2065379 RepID=A0A2K9ME19_9RHOB|nr:hypothetical protein [Paracoccus jeotgali]AUM73732.1 hypothetical protein CYR75_05045 [Paracoccus jeotgali]